MLDQQLVAIEALGQEIVSRRRGARGQFALHKGLESHARRQCRQQGGRRGAVDSSRIKLEGRARKRILCKGFPK